MIDELLLLSGNDIPFIAAGITIHAPTLKEIGLIGEEAFFTGCELLNFSKDILTEEDKINLEEHTNFDIFIAILRERNAVMQKNRNCIELVLALLFPEYSIDITSTAIELTKEDKVYKIDNSNFENFKEILTKMFPIHEDSNENNQNYNPGGELAKSIADKLKKRHQKLAELKNTDNIEIISRYISILSVGECKDMNVLLQYNLYQLFDEFKRFQLKMNYDIYIQAKMAGAKDLKEVEDWMESLHSKKKK